MRASLNGNSYHIRFYLVVKFYYILKEVRCSRLSYSTSIWKGVMRRRKCRTYEESLNSLYRNSVKQKVELRLTFNQMLEAVSSFLWCLNVFRNTLRKRILHGDDFSNGFVKISQTFIVWWWKMLWINFNFSNFHLLRPNISSSFPFFSLLQISPSLYWEWIQILL